MARFTRIPKPLQAARNAAQRLYDLTVGVEQLRSSLQVLSAKVASVDARIETLDSQARTRHSETFEALRLVRDDEPANRQRLWRLRQTEDYALAFTEPEPLVSVCIATYANTELLLERALPSVLGQTYERIEVVIVGDGAAPEVERAVKGVGDPRVRYSNTTLRGPYPDDPDLLWYVAGGPPSNEAMRLAQGRWIASMDDDDESTPDRIELLLRASRERDLEFCYGQIVQHHPGGETKLLCEFPPDYAKVGLQASIMHADMRFICAELGDAQFREVGDWSRIRRMMRIGVRMGMIDDIVLQYYPGLLWKREAGQCKRDTGSAASEMPTPKPQIRHQPYIDLINADATHAHEQAEPTNRAVAPGLRSLTHEEATTLAARTDFTWHQRFELAPGVFTPGTSDLGFLLEAAAIPEHLDGLSVLDIGTTNGAAAFECERRGASRVVAVDIADENWFGFAAIKEALSSRAEHVQANIYELPELLGEQFDVVLFWGVLYHLRHPLLALDNVRRIARGTVSIETATSDHELPPDTRLSLARFYRTDELAGDSSNWFAPNMVALVDWCRSSGLEPTRVLGWPDRAPARAMIVASVTEPEYLRISYERAMSCIVAGHGAHFGG